jgi:hypothetical protein
VVDFGDALLDACPADQFAEVMTEAEMLASAFAPRGRGRQIDELAESLRMGAARLEAGRAHVCRLAAALRRLARGERPIARSGPAA